MTIHNKIILAEKLIKDVLLSEIDNTPGNTYLNHFSNEIISFIVNHWYCHGRCADIFQNHNGIEIDEYLNVEEIKLK
jgi:hypothetical protein